MRCSTKKGAILALVVAVFILVSLLPMSVSAAVVSPDGWEWQNPLPQGNGLSDVWGSSSFDVFAVGNDGTILNY